MATAVEAGCKVEEGGRGRKRKKRGVKKRGGISYINSPYINAYTEILWIPVGRQVT
jgi:hypothetical protein